MDMSDHRQKEEGVLGELGRNISYKVGRRANKSPRRKFKINNKNDKQI